MNNRSVVQAYMLENNESPPAIIKTGNRKGYPYRVLAYLMLLLIVLFMPACGKGYKHKLIMRTSAETVNLKLQGWNLVSIDWGDGSPKDEYFLYLEEGEWLEVSHTYAAPKEYNITIKSQTGVLGLACGNNQLLGLDLRRNPFLEVLHCWYNPMTSLDLSKNTLLREVVLYGNKFSAVELNNIFDSLHENKIEGREIYINDNPGAANCDPLIAEVKGWKLYGYTGAGSKETIFWTLMDGVLNISGIGPMEGRRDDGGDIIYPWSSKKGQIHTVIIGDRITSIGDKAFWGYFIEKVVFGNSVSSIGDLSFAYNKIAQVNFPSSLRSIGEVAFMSNLLTSVTIPHSVEFLGNGAFFHSPIQRISIGDNVRYGRGSFNGVFNGSMDEIYINNGRQAGVYVSNFGAWSKLNATDFETNIANTNEFSGRRQPWMELIPDYHAKFINFAENAIGNARSIIQAHVSEPERSIPMGLLNSKPAVINNDDFFDYKKVRSIQHSTVYNFFDCRFSDQNNRIFFQKTSGSLLREGYLYRIDEYSFVVIGAFRQNMGLNWSPGYLFKTSDDKLVIIFPNFDNFDEIDGVEIYEIIK